MLKKKVDLYCNVLDSLPAGMVVPLFQKAWNTFTTSLYLPELCAVIQACLWSISAEFHLRLLLKCSDEAVLKTRQILRTIFSRCYERNR